MINQHLEQLKTKLKNKERLIGTGVWLTDTSVSEHLGTIGFDFVWIDQEHSGFTKEHIRSHILASELSGMVTFVRVTDHNPSTVKPILELAPDGVIFPMVNSAADAENVVAACLYPPDGIRGYGPTRADRFGSIPNEEYVRDVAGTFWRIMQIEHVDGVKNLDEILSVKGVDAIVVGPNDLSASIGLLGQHRHPDVMKLMDKIADTCNRRGVPFGVSMGYHEQNITDWINRGASMLEIGLDHYYLDIGARMVLDGTKQLLSGNGGKDHE